MFEATFSYKLIYVFQIDDDKHRGLLKIGDATLKGDKDFLSYPPNCSELNEAAKKRISSYTRTASIDYNLLYTEIAVRIKDGKPHAFKDTLVRDVLYRSGFKKHEFDFENQGKEWVEADLSNVISAIKAVKEYRMSLYTDEINDAFTPIYLREEQEAAINQTLKTFKTSNRILWNAKMRFGKTVTALEVAKRMKARQTVIITHRPAVKENWSEDFNKIFHGTDYQFGSKYLGESYANLKKIGKPFVYFASTQDLGGSEDVGGNMNKNSDILQNNWDLVVIDEAHEGTQTELGKKIIETISKDAKIISLSGTPFNLMSEYEQDEIFTWDYIMEQKAKAEWPLKHFGDSNPYEDLPTLEMYVYNLDKTFPTYIDNEDMAFNFREFFRTWTGNPEIDRANIPINAKVGDFIHEKDVNSFLNLISEDSENSNFPYSKEEFRNYYKHTLWVVPGVKEARALSALLKKHPIFGNEQFFKIANVAGEGDIEVPFDDALSLVRKAIGDNPDERNSITITCSSGRLTTGVTIPEWTAVLMLAGSCKTSPSSYLQTIFRIQNPADINGRVKERCTVFDFAPDRTLKMVAEAGHLSARVGNTNNDDRRAMAEFLNYCPVISVEGSSMKKYDVEHLLQQLKRAYAEQVVRNGFDDYHLYNDNLLKDLSAIELADFEKLKAKIGTTKQTKKIKDIDINTQGFTDEEYDLIQDIEKKPRKLLSEEERKLLEELKEKRKNRDNAISILRGISIRIPLMVFGAEIKNDEEIRVDNFTDIVDNVSWIEFMPDGVTKDDFRKFSKYYEQDVFVDCTRRIRQITLAADELNPTERAKEIGRLFSTFRNPDKETVLTPWSVVNMHMSDCLGGYKFYDAASEMLLENPVFVDKGNVTKNVFKNPYAKILEINSKSGLYPLYIAYSIYRNKIKMLNINEENIESSWTVWQETLNNNIFVICKTKMAKSITRRTLLGYKKGNINAHAFDDLPMQIKYKPEQFRAKISRGSFWNKEEQFMKFNAVVGNPPYAQVLDSEQGRSLSSQLFPYFIMNSILLDPDYVSLITPSRWFTADAQDDSFIKLRDFMKSHSHICSLFIYDSTNPIFDNVEIKGGVSYFLYDKKYNDDVEFNLVGKNQTRTQIRPLFEEDSDIIFGDSIQYDIYKKVCTLNFVSLETMAKGRNAFGVVGKESFVHSCTTENPTSINTIELRCKGNEIRYISRDCISDKSKDVFEHFKVFISKSAGDPTKDKKVIGTPYLGKPYTACTDSLIPIGCFDTEEEAVNLMKYICTKFLRFMVSILKTSQNVYQNVYKFVPVQNFTSNSDIDWSKSISEIDKQLFKKYNLSEEEINVICSSVIYL